MRVYLDNCCFNRPFDDQTQVRIRLETEAKLFIQESVLEGRLQLVWPYVLNYENVMNPFEERRDAIRIWRCHATVDVAETPDILQHANVLVQLGLKGKDALHVACASAANSDCFVTTDDSILKKRATLADIVVVDPPTLVRSLAP